jgi:WD40 repeat protein
VATGRELATGQIGPPVKCFAVSPNGRRVLSSHNRADVLLWDTDTGALLKEFRPQKLGNTEAVAFAADGRRGLAGGFGGIARLLDVETGNVLDRFGGGQIIRQLAIAPDESVVLTADLNGTLSLYRRK